jgi:hypothetical protein
MVDGQRHPDCDGGPGDHGAALGASTAAALVLPRCAKMILHITDRSDAIAPNGLL